MDSSPLIDVRELRAFLEQEDAPETWQVQMDRVSDLALPALVRRLVMLLADECDLPFETAGQRIWRWLTRRPRI